MFLQRKISRLDRTKKTLHRKVECWIVILDHGQQIANRDLCIKFFFNFPFQGLLRSFTRLNLSTRELPAIFEFTVTTLSSEDSISILYDCGYNIYCFHQ